VRESYAKEEEKVMDTQTRTAASNAPSRRFDSIEGSHDFVVQLLQAVEETAAEVGEDLRLTRGAVSREREALQLIAFKLEQLRFHLATSRRRLRDLRTLRGILRGEGPADARPAATAA
jgi:hypothetical protein